MKFMNRCANGVIWGMSDKMPDVVAKFQKLWLSAGGGEIGGAD